jgi:hypothetical protein
VSAVTNGCIDGWTGGNNQTFDNVGIDAKAIVDSDNRLYVFYGDYSVNSVRFSYMDSGTSTWYSGVVQSSVQLEAPPAAITSGVDGGVVQVFYVNALNNTLQGATRNGNSFAWQATVDGGSSNLCSGHGGTSHVISGPIAGVYDQGVCRSGYGPGGSPGPRIYYNDDTTGALREAFWY